MGPAPLPVHGLTTAGGRRASRLRRALLAIAALAALWALVTSLTGGFLIHLGSLRISSRNARNPLVIALVSIAAAWALAPRDQRRPTLRAEWSLLSAPLATRLSRLWSILGAPLARRPRLVASSVTALIAIGVVSLGLLKGALVAGGSDSYGYASQARLWASGSLRFQQPLADDPPGGISREALVPLGYRLGLDGTSLVPVYAPGLPMLMAVFERVGGPPAVFYVMPLLAGVAVWCTSILGTIVAGRAAGVVAALLLATSPAFLFQLTHAPMSDIPAAALWSVALVLVGRRSRLAALCAGLAAAAAILTRPNLVPLAIVPAALLLWRAGDNRADRIRAAHALLLFVAASIPGAVAVALLNDYWYGSPMASGYGPLAGTFYQWSHFRPNVAFYTRWMSESQTPLVFVAAAAPFLAWNARRGNEERHGARAMLIACGASAAIVYLCYAFYLPFDAWWYLRFLLPAFPMIFVLVGGALVGACARLPARARVLACGALVAVVVSHNIGFARRNNALDSRQEWRFADAGHYIADRLPQEAVLFAMHHSGSARYYSGRLTIRYDYLAPSQLDPAVDELRRRGYVPYILLDDWEVPEFMSRFAGASRLGALDWTPVAALPGVALYGVSGRPAEK